MLTDHTGSGGLYALFTHQGEILDAAAKARDKKFERWDVFTPYPIHGMDDAMGLGRSWIPWVTFTAGMTGLAIAMAMQIGTMTIDWPMNIGGKPFLPWPSFMPIAFELTVLIGGLTTVAVMFLSGGLPNLRPKIVDPRITTDKFALYISADDPQFDAVATREFLESLEPLTVEEVRFDQ
jgi:hypothetical protein